MIVIVDYGMGNLRSVLKSFERLKIPVQISSDIDTIQKAEKLILPGVGHFENGMRNLHRLNLIDCITNKVLHKKTPVLGICLGMQLMAKHSEEGNVMGFGWFDAEVIKFQIKNTDLFKIPHIGWNTIRQTKDCDLFKGINDDSEFYFVHSYHIQCNIKQDILNISNYEYDFVSAISKDNIYGVQYHPEKSHAYGEILIQNFVNL